MGTGARGARGPVRAADGSGSVEEGAAGPGLAFLEGLRRRASLRPRRIAFPEASEARTRAAIELLAREGLARPVAVGPGGEVRALEREIPGVAAVETEDPPLEAAAALLAVGEVEGVVAGAHHPTPEVIRAGLHVVGPAEGIATVSSSFYMVLRHPTPGGQWVLTFTDAGVVPEPTAEQLSEIAEAACRERRRIVGDAPRVAFLSYSTAGSAGGASVERVRRAFQLFRARCPGVVAAGELQADAAIVPEVARRKAPASPVAGDANVLVFPDLDAGNIAYKLVERLAEARALGPILQGLARPLNDLSRGAAVEDIVHVACITALMAAPVGEDSGAGAGGEAHGEQGSGGDPGPDRRWGPR